MMHMMDNFAQSEGIEEVDNSLTPDQEDVLDELGRLLDGTRYADLEEEAARQIEMTLYEHGMLQPQDL